MIIYLSLDQVIPLKFSLFIAFYDLYWTFWIAMKLIFMNSSETYLTTLPLSFSLACLLSTSCKTYCHSLPPTSNLFSPLFFISSSSLFNFMLTKAKSKIFTIKTDISFSAQFLIVSEAIQLVQNKNAFSPS